MINLQVRREDTHGVMTKEVYLEQASDGINVCTIDGWNILKLKNDGTFYRHENIDADETGFKVTAKGQLVESKEE